MNKNPIKFSGIEMNSSKCKRIYRFNKTVNKFSRMKMNSEELKTLQSNSKT